MASAQLTYPTLFVDYDSSWTYKNLKIIPVRAKADGRVGITDLPHEGKEVVPFRRAIQQGLITISERGTASVENVHWLRVNNNSDKPLFIASGEVVMGGRQDRMVTKDTILVPNGKDQYVPVMCVEEDRWSDKEKKFAYSNYANPRLRKVLDSSGNQVLIWKEVLHQLDGSSTHAPTLAYLARRQDKKIIAEQNEYMKFFSDKLKNVDTTVIGIVCISGNRIIGCDVFADRDMFKEEVDPLLAGYVEEAITFGGVPAADDEKVKKYLGKFLADEKSQEQYCKKNGKLFRYKKRVFHLTAYAE